MIDSEQSITSFKYYFKSILLIKNYYNKNYSYFQGKYLILNCFKKLR